MSRKRARVVSDDAFVAFTRRIVASYARRVGGGEVETLRSLVALSADVDEAIRQAVHGLRDRGVSWSAIGEQLGSSAHAVATRWGSPKDRGTLDRRLLDGGLSLSVATLVALFRAHHPGIPAASSCPTCGYSYERDEADCPSNRVVRALLVRRRFENPKAFHRLPRDLREDLARSRTRSVAHSSAPDRGRMPLVLSSREETVDGT
jgi:hypothetical protein